jgi:hypothetical protein
VLKLELMSFQKQILYKFLLALVISEVGIPRLALAYQDAQVTQDAAMVYEMPSSESSLLSDLKKGQHLKVSSKWVTDEKGLNWYKVLADGKFGYVMANNLETGSVRRELAGVKIESNYLNEPDAYVRSWSFALRGMLSAASQVMGSSIVGNEFELSYAIPFRREGAWRHLISLGIAYVNYSDNNPKLFGSIVLRIPARWRLQPEIRIRAGKALAGSFQIGGVFGFQYPFSASVGTHLGAFGEVGSMYSLADGTNSFFGSLGLGIHF